MIMYLNNKMDEPITIGSYSRNLSLGEGAPLYQIDINWNDNYSPASIEKIYSYARIPIASIKIVRNKETVLETANNVNLQLSYLNEAGTDEGLYAACGFVAHEQEE